MGKNKTQLQINNTKIDEAKGYVDSMYNVPFNFGNASPADVLSGKTFTSGDLDPYTGGWNGCEMRTYCNSTIYNRMPTDLKPHITQVKKKGYDGISTTILTSNDYIWLLAEIEVLGEKKHSAGTGEGTKYPIFTDNKSRIRNQNNVPSLWFLRSPFASSAAYFCDVYTSGEISNLSASSTAGVLIGFCI